MKYSFEAKIYKVGINPCVKVPLKITDKMEPSKGYIPIKGNINEHEFIQTLVSVKGEGYRLYVNGPMLKGSNTKLGDKVKFTIEQDFIPRNVPLPMSKEFKKVLEENELLKEFKKLTAYRQKEILRYLDRLKSKEAKTRNIAKVIKEFKDENSTHWFVASKNKK